MARRKRGRRSASRKRRGASFTGKEKNSFKRGFWKGFWSARKNKSGSTKTKNSRKKRVGAKNSVELRYASQQNRLKGEIERMANAYARHMGRKFSLSEAEIQKNAKRHFEEAMNDPKMLAFLYEPYGSYLK